jgi:hypothetical protein
MASFKLEYKFMFTILFFVFEIKGNLGEMPICRFGSIVFDNN